MTRLLKVVDDFCEWSGILIKLKKSLITAQDFCAGKELPTEKIKNQEKPLTSRPADEKFPYLWIRASLVEMGRRKGPASSQAPGLNAE
jgi:hypothetical protein